MGPDRGAKLNEPGHFKDVQKLEAPNSFSGVVGYWGFFDVRDFMNCDVVEVKPSEVSLVFLGGSGPGQVGGPVVCACLKLVKFALLGRRSVLTMC